MSQKLHAAPTVVNAAPAKDALLLICPATSLWNPNSVVDSCLWTNRRFWKLKTLDIAAKSSSSLGPEIRYPIWIRMTSWLTYQTLARIIKNSRHESQ